MDIWTRSLDKQPKKSTVDPGQSGPGKIAKDKIKKRSGFITGCNRRAHQDTIGRSNTGSGTGKKEAEYSYTCAVLRSRSVDLCDPVWTKDHQKVTFIRDNVSQRERRVNHIFL